MSDTALVPATAVPSNEVALIPKPTRVRLKGLPASAFQHPLDRQATESLKRIKGFNTLVGKFIEYGFERIEYVSNIGGAIRIGPRQMPRHYTMLLECCDVLDVDEPELYVMQGGVNAYTGGHNHPFIVLETGCLELMNDDEVMAVIARQVGHIKCGHVLYQSMFRGIRVLLDMGGVIAGLIGAGVAGGLSVWDRRSQLSADRAALLGIQDPQPCVTMLMRLAGGTRRHEVSLDAAQFLNQARAYKEGLDEHLSGRFYRFIANMGTTHPFAVERARALDEWSGSREYKDILDLKYLSNPLAVVTMKACPKCPNLKYPPTEHFCAKCGTPLAVH